MSQRRREATANDSNSPKVQRREGYLVNYVPLKICRDALLLLRQRRGAAGNGLSTTINYLRRKTNDAAGNGLSTTIKYLRGVAGIDLGTTIRYRTLTTTLTRASAVAKLLLTTRARRRYMNTASKLGPHTQTDRGTCPGVGL
jgi:hypothetical protein